MGIKFGTKMRVGLATAKLREKRAINENEFEAISIYLTFNGNYEKITERHEAMSFWKKRPSRGHTKLVYQLGYFARIERMVQEHIIPAIEKRGIYAILSSP